MAEERLQKVLAARGIASRRKCEELIRDGAVRVNGKVVDTLPAFVDPEKDRIVVQGKAVKTAEKVYYMLNKPLHVICTNADPMGRKKAIDLIPSPERIFCVGRLDAETTGLIILTNDSELTNRLTHPKYKIPKKYVAHVKGKVGPDVLDKIKKGVWLAEGKTGRAGVKVIKRSQTESLLEITISQGLNRQVRRTLADVGLPVKSLKRIKVGKLELKGIGVGSYRPLSTREVEYLKKLVLLTEEKPKS